MFLSNHFTFFIILVVTIGTPNDDAQSKYSYDRKKNQEFHILILFYSSIIEVCPSDNQYYNNRTSNGKKTTL